MDKLWAPWRAGYIYLGRRKKCIFCGNRKSRKSATRHIIERTRHSFSILNLYPYNNGHVMVSPYKHVRSLEALSGEELEDLMGLVKKMKMLLDRRLKPDGYNIGLNIGKAGGAGYEGHIHIHVVPRWIGDTNFMPVVSGAKVVSDSLEAVYKLLKADR